jgi:hypothetical protein
MARNYFPKRDPVGKRIFMHWGSGAPPAFMIIGVVGDIKDLGLDAPVEPTIYWPGVGGEAVLFARTNADPLSLASAVRQAALSIDPALPLQPARNVEETLDTSLAHRRFTLNLLCVSALLALLLAAIGIYGVVFIFSRAARAGDRNSSRPGRTSGRRDQAHTWTWDHSCVYSAWRWGWSERLRSRNC